MRRPRPRAALEWLVVIGVAVVLATATRAYAVGTYFIPSPSMTPTLTVGDRIVVNKLSGPIHRGDIVVFHDVPADTGGPPVLVKRVVGLPGDIVSGSGDTVFVDFKPLPQPWLPTLTGECARPNRSIIPTRVPPGQYYVLGDCRGDSDDSRFWGTVPSSNIIGKVDAIVWRNGHPWWHWF